MTSLRRGDEVRYVFTLVLSLFEPLLSFLRVPNNQYTNTGLNGAKICQIKVAGRSGTD